MICRWLCSSSAVVCIWSNCWNIISQSTIVLFSLGTPGKASEGGGGRNLAVFLSIYFPPCYLFLHISLCCESAGVRERMIEKRDKGCQTILGIHFTEQCGTIWYFFHFGIHFLLKFDKILLQHNEKGNFMKKILLLYPVFVGVCGDKPVIFLYSSIFLYSRSYFCRNSFVKWNFFVIF